MKAKIKDFTVHYNPNDNGIGPRLVLKKGEREPGFQWMIEKEARGVFYDVGANIGWITLLASKRCDKIYCFEPDKRNLEYLVKNCKENYIRSKCFINNEAITDHVGTCKMTFAKKPNLNTVCGSTGEDIPCTTIDEYCKASPAPNAMKMDIEGGEVGAITGAMETLKNNNVKLFIELHPEKYGPDNDFRAVLEKLLEIGYYFKYVENAKDKEAYFLPYDCAKRFALYTKRAVYTNIHPAMVLEMCIKIDGDGKKIVRSIMMEKA